MEGQALAAGARMELRDGWNVAVAYPDAPARDAPVAWADVSHLRKRRGRTARHELTFGTATRIERRVVVPGHARAHARDRRRRRSTALEVTTALAALAIVGPLAREVFARFCALDLRPQALPVGGFRPGSVARTPGYVLREDADRFLMLFGWALGEYMWTVVADAASAPRRRRRWASTRSTARPRVRDIFRRRRMWRPRPDAEGLLRRRHHRRRLARPGHRLLPARARDHRRLHPREELHRLGRGRAQHDDPALELQDARGRALLRRAA